MACDGAVPGLHASSPLPAGMPGAASDGRALFLRQGSSVRRVIGKTVLKTAHLEKGKNKKSKLLNVVEGNTVAVLFFPRGPVAGGATS